MCLRLVFLLITRLAAGLRLSRRAETWKTAEILLLPPARRPATAAAAPPEAELGGPGPPRDPAQRDTQSAAPEPAAAGYPQPDLARPPRHRPPPLGRQVHARQDRPAGHQPEHQGPRPAAGPGEPRMGVGRIHGELLCRPMNSTISAVGGRTPPRMAGLGVKVVCNPAQRAGRRSARPPHPLRPG